MSGQTQALKAIATDTNQQQTAGVPAVFDAEAWHAMQERDTMLIRDEVLHGYAGKEYVYDFTIQQTKVRGVSVVGARALATFYGGIKTRLVASVDKTGALFVFKSFEPLAVMAQRVMELADDPDFYEVVIEVQDIKTGNSTQVRKKEFKTEKRSASKGGGSYDRPHYDVIAESKAKRNGILELIPQDVIRAFMERCLKAGDSKTEKTIDQLRAGLLSFCAKNAIAVERAAIEELTYDQIYGLGAAANGGVEQFRAAAVAMGIVAGEKASLSQSAGGTAAPAGAAAVGKDDADATQTIPGAGAKTEPAKAKPAAADVPADLNME